jgi:hypothetical protein
MMKTHHTTDTCCKRLHDLSFTKKMVAEEGLEPPTRGL